jgi:hypothetical protein
LTWLKAFRDVRVDSIFKTTGNGFVQRTFRFSEECEGVSELTERPSRQNQRKTTVSLNGFAPPFQEEAPRSAAVIARRLLEHCLWYYISPHSSPRITLYDVAETIAMRDVYQTYVQSSIIDSEVDVKGVPFQLRHVRLRASTVTEHSIVYGANGRAVRRDAINASKIPGLRGPIVHEDGDFTYCCYVTSAFLDEHVRPERAAFDIPSSPSELLAQNAVTMSEIEAAVIGASTNYLAPFLGNVRQEGRKRVMRYITQSAVRYRSMVPYLSEADFFVDPKITDKELELRLHDRWYEIEKSFLKEGHEILSFMSQESREDYQSRIAEYRNKVNVMRQSDLANYVFHRKEIINMLETATKRGSDGSYQREDIIHQLVMPMRKTSEHVHEDQCNLWLLDEKLVFHYLCASDKTIGSVVNSKDAKEPDLCVVDIWDEPMLVSDDDEQRAALTVVEFKRPMRADVGGKDEDPISQVLEYLLCLRKGTVRDLDGRLILTGKDVPGYCYVVCDLTEKVQACCERNQLHRRRDGRGYFGYHPNYNAYIEVISYNDMVRAAKMRNYAFFRRLGLPTN